MRDCDVADVVFAGRVRRSGWWPVALVALAGVSTGCQAPVREPATTAAPRPATPAPVTLTLLYTADEHGWIAPAVDKGRARGGAAAMLGRWRRDEGHCVPAPGETCEGSSTIALSGGDNWTGPALSSYFQGASAAEVMGKLGYAASAVGNHELDFGRAVFDRNASAQGIPYLAANVEPGLDEGGVGRPFVMVRRRGVNVAVIGLSTQHTPESGMRDNYKGLRFKSEEQALERYVPAAYEAGADAVVTIGHVCAEDLRPIVAHHGEWHLAMAGGGHCHRAALDQVFTTPIVEPGAFLKSYARITVTIDPARARGQRVIQSRAELVDLTYPEGSAPPAPPDPTVAAVVAGWQQKTDQALGEVIGHTDEPLEPDTPPLTNFLTDRWREEYKADAVILNRYGTRQALGPGQLTLGSIYSVLPFDNKLVTVHLTGKQLMHDVRCCGGHVSGLRESKGGELQFFDGRAIDPAARYTVVVTDYTYFGGSGFPFEKQDPNGVFGEDWRPSLIRWLKQHPTAPGRGLDKLVDREPRLRTSK